MILKTKYDMIPIKEAISSAAWLNCVNEDQSIHFRVKIISFNKFSLEDINEPEKIKLIDSNGQWRVLQIEVVSLSKKIIYSSDGPGELLIIDQDGFEFEVTYDDHLWRSSDFGMKIGLRRFYFEKLIPKVKAIGALAFFLPDDDEAVYSISLKEGTISEA